MTDIDEIKNDITIERPKTPNTPKTKKRKRRLKRNSMDITYMDEAADCFEDPNVGYLVYKMFIDGFGW